MDVKIIFVWLAKNRILQIHEFHGFNLKKWQVEGGLFPSIITRNLPIKVRWFEVAMISCSQKQNSLWIVRCRLKNLIILKPFTSKLLILVCRPFSPKKKVSISCFHCLSWPLADLVTTSNYREAKIYLKISDWPKHQIFGEDTGDIYPSQVLIYHGSLTPC